MIVLRVPAGSDNQSYVLSAKEGKRCAVIDPADPEDIMEAASEANLGKIAAIINTHGHPDHTGGNPELVRRTGAKLYAHDPDRVTIPGEPKPLSEGRSVNVDGMSVRVIHTPGHTPGSICLLVKPSDGPPHLFSGDTVFVAGCGNPRFGGDPEQLYESFKTRIHTLSDDTVIHPGHDYARRNLEFALSVEPGNTAARRKLEEAKFLESGEKMLETTVAEERGHNPFFRLDSPEIRQVLSEKFNRPFEDDKSVFLALRELRNKW